MDLRKELILDYIKSINIDKGNLLSALEDLDIEELERFVAILTRVRYKVPEVGRRIYSNKLGKTIVISKNNFMKDKIDYCFSVKKYAKTDDLNPNKHTVSEEKSDIYSVEVDIEETGSASFDELF